MKVWQAAMQSLLQIDLSGSRPQSNGDDAPVGRDRSAVQCPHCYFIIIKEEASPPPFFPLWVSKKGPSKNYLSQPRFEEWVKQKASCEVLFLPLYSPDLNPVESLSLPSIGFFKGLNFPFEMNLILSAALKHEHAGN